MVKTIVSEALDVRIKPLLDEAMHKYLGISVDEIKSDISDKIKKSPLIDFMIDTNIPFKRAKIFFKKYYINKILMLHFGNISEVSRILGITREALHRLINELKIDPDIYRKELIKAEYVKESKIKDIIEGTLDMYKNSLNPEKFKELYQNVPLISKNIVKELPGDELTLKRAERSFEKKYLTKALSENNHNISKTAKKIGLRFETLHRKMKKLEIK